MAYRIAIVGLGQAAQRIHLPAYRSIHSLEIVGGCDPVAKAEKFPFPLFASVPEMLEKTKPHILAVATPPDSHFALTAAVGGSVENGVCETALDWATFLCEYSGFMGPVKSGSVPASAMPGMNVAYRRSAITEINRAIRTRGFWETTVHPLLAEKGMGFYLSDSVRIFHKKKFSFYLFAKQRFLYSRYYAGIRFSPDQKTARLAMCALTLALPPLLLFRMARCIAHKQRLPELIRALPYLTLFALIWAGGEVVGYMLGPGDALVRIE